MIKHIFDSVELSAFLDDGNCSVLAARLEFTQDVCFIQVYNSFKPSNNAANVVNASGGYNWLIFFKLRPTTINPDNLHSNVIVSSMLDFPIDTLYHSVQKVFGPVLLKDSHWNKTIDPKLQSLLVELEAGLGSTLRKHNQFIALDASASTQSLEDASLAGILTPMDEYKFWSDELLQPVANSFTNIDSLSFVEALELVEVTQDALDDLWKQVEHEPVYPEKRMKHMSEVMSDSVGRFIQRKLGVLDDGVHVCEKWSSAAEMLTLQYWKNYSSHPWKGKNFSSPNLQQLIDRLEEAF
ncbi:cytoplasmic dynein 2 heavy chain 1-like [Dysidea avara]|uniref:cytoplasmic dynein 2 heavy chain 1-like n=1 Tax=Dysidea avara TaxID=196820 RepID=UPI003327B7CF